MNAGMGPTEGISTYYSANVTKSDAERVQRFTESLKITQLYNSRLFKLVKPDGSVLFQVRLASAESGNVSSGGGDGGAAELAAIGRVHEFEGQRIEVVRGDHAPLMARVVANLEKAVEFAANDTQKAMIRKYAESFRTGSMLAHIEGSAGEWIVMWYWTATQVLDRRRAASLMQAHTHTRDRCSFNRFLSSPVQSG